MDYYSIEVKESLGGEQVVAQLSWYFPYLKAGLQGLAQELDGNSKHQIEGLKKVLLSIEEYLFFAGDDDFGGDSLTFKKMRKTLENHKIVMPDAPEHFEAYNVLCYFYNAITSAIGYEECEKFAQTGRFRNPLIIIAVMINDLLMMVNGDKRWEEHNSWAENIMSNLKR